MVEVSGRLVPIAGRRVTIHNERNRVVAGSRPHSKVLLHDLRG